MSDFLTVEMYIKSRALKKNPIKLFFHAIARFCWFYLEHDSFMSLFVQILSCLSRQTDVSSNNAPAIGPSLSPPYLK